MERTDSSPPLIRPRLGVSSCLLGRPVRYDGGHRRDDFLADQLGPHVDFVEVCPEVEIGLGTPRPTIDLYESDDPGRPRLRRGEVDLTETMETFAETRVAALKELELDGYALKARSPSCGLRDAKLIRLDGRVEREGKGVFARVLRSRWPDLVAFDESDLEEPAVTEARMTALFARARFRARPPGMAGLQEFHRRHKYLLLSRAPEILRELGALLGRGEDCEETHRRYETLFCFALSNVPTRGRQTDALFHMFGYVSSKLESIDKRELVDSIEDYGSGHIGLAIPARLLWHWVRHFEDPYLLEQAYFLPYPPELGLLDSISAA